MLKKFLLYYNTIKYLKAEQITHRLYAKIKFVLPRKTLYLEFKPEPINKKTDFLFYDYYNKPEKIKSGFFTFLNKEENLGRPVNWKCTNSDLLWQFNLHYFNYLYLLNNEEKLNYCRDWIQNASISKAANHPYTTSLRIINWIKNNIQDKEVNESLLNQTEHLYNNIESYHPANHYLENARALIFAGIYFNNEVNSKKWFNKGKEIYLKELPKQVLRDGCYFELSAMYHCIMLEGFLDVYNILPDNESELKDLLKETNKRMLGFLKKVLHPDETIPLLNDSAYKIAASPEQIFDYAIRLGLNSINSNRNDSGYYTYRNNNIFMCIDGGELGPDFIPAHAHADIFNYELSVRNKKFIVDTGVYEYKQGEKRKYSRSTVAHNTVSIDGKDQAEIWGSFRVAKRYKPQNILCSENENGFSFSGDFFGFNNLIGDKLHHNRIIKIDKLHHNRIINIDKLQNDISIIDKVNGIGEHHAENFIHLHPNVNIMKKDNFVILSNEEVKLSLEIKNNYSIEESHYYPEFGKELKNKVIVLKEKAPCTLEYMIREINE